MKLKWHGGITTHIIVKIIVNVKEVLIVQNIVSLITVLKKIMFVKIVPLVFILEKMIRMVV